MKSGRSEVDVGGRTKPHVWKQFYAYCVFECLPCKSTKA